MIFCGDIALPYKDAINFIDIPQSLKNQAWIGNLEGSLIHVDESEKQNLLSHRIVFNDYEAIKKLCNDIPFTAFGLANNHIKDAADIKTTTINLEELGIVGFGAGIDDMKAEQPFEIHDSDNDYIIVAFGWKFIKCIYANSNNDGVNAYERENVLNQIERLVNTHKNKRIIAFMHWNNELELYPQPLDRELAHKLIDMGVYAIIGCHAHRVQPIEFYEGHLIAYGLGNFAFPHNVYFGGRLKFPEFTYEEYVVEFNHTTPRLHKFIYSPSKSMVKYEGLCDETIIAEFSTLTSKQYKNFFKKNRYQRKALPVIYYEDSAFNYNFKYNWIRLRGKLIEILFRNQALFNGLKSLATKIWR